MISLAATNGGVIPILTALAAVGGLATGGVGLYLRFRKETKDTDIAVKKDDRDEESQDMATVRGIASDTLARLTLAYQRLDAAENAATQARKEAAGLREQVLALEGEVDSIRPRIKTLEDQHEADVESISRLERANKALDNDIKRLLAEKGGRASADIS